MRESDQAGVGRLVIVATPIGNLGDLSERAVQALATVDLVLAEDTRRTRKLLTHAGISAKLLSYHRDNETKRLDGLIGRMTAGESLALVSDAGVPLISDPGAVLVGACIDRGIPVECVPGPSAVTAALVLSGLKADRFVFEGFLPRSKGARRKHLQCLAEETRTIVLFEAPHRVRQMLADASQILGGERKCAVCRELTKLHEEVWRGSLGDALAHFEATEPRGEFVIVISGSDLGAGLAEEVETVARSVIGAAIESGSTPRMAAEAGEAAGISRNKAYKLALAIAREKASSA